jgi:hypothetical protein
VDFGVLYIFGGPMEKILAYDVSEQKKSETELSKCAKKINSPSGSELKYY